MGDARATIEGLARDRLGFTRLRPGQLGAVEALAGGRCAGQRYDGDEVTVLFDEHGYRELFLPVVLERGLLRPAAGPGAPGAMLE